MIQAESFKPRPVVSPVKYPWLFFARSLVDLQLATVASFLKPILPKIRGHLLDIGAGEAPWRDWLSDQARYTGLDVESAASFGMSRQPDVIYFKGGSFPFGDNTFDAMLCVEVLEHVATPAEFLAEVFRVGKPGAELFLTVPWSARRHHIPFDFFRFTPDGLAQLLRAAGFEIGQVIERGSDISAIANKLIVLVVRLMKPRPWISWAYRLPLALACLPIAGMFVVAHHLSILLRYQGGKEDPLGYAVVARKPGCLASASSL
jgi:SAM-dependent methyltransferase